MASKNTAKGLASEQTLTPFLKWAGGKRWLARRHLELFETDYDRYVEPFLGGASMFFALQPGKSILADRNERLIEAYVAIRSDPKRVATSLNRYQESHSDSSTTRSGNAPTRIQPPSAQHS